jgi:hypothetical protein
VRKLSQEQWIEKAKMVHGDFYNYSIVEYIKGSSYVKIICPKHGVFEQSANSHLTGRKCKKCTGRHGWTVANFAMESNIIHENKYDYIEFNGIRGFAKISCFEHGVFEQRADDHLKGHGCAKCANRDKKDIVWFLKKSMQVHGQTYDYSSVTTYQKGATKIKIKCPKHGEFEQTGADHLSGRGCPSCSPNKKLTQKEFINGAKKVHGNIYDYSFVEYKNSIIKVKIVCQYHGEFEQTPTAHLSGHGCFYCGNERISKRQMMTQSQFIEKAKKVHGNKYSYKNSIYTGCYDKVIITCPIHGDFSQQPSNHLQSAGCPICVESKGEKIVAKTLEKIGLLFNRQARFRTCRLKRILPFDFIVKTITNTVFLIEYNGSPHYRPIRWNKKMTEEKAKQIYEDVKIRDKIKTKWAKDRGIPILVIPFWEKNQIEQIIIDFVKTL